VDSNTVVAFVKEIATQTHILHLIGHTVFPAAGVSINEHEISPAEKVNCTDML